MVYRNSLATILLALALAPVACGGSKTDTKTPDNEGTGEAVTKPPPAPTCDALDSMCTAKADTVVQVKSAPLKFTSPTGWKYAALDAFSIVQSSGEPNAAVMVIGSYASDKDAKKNDLARDAAFADLLKALGAKLPNGYKVNWKKPEAPLEANGLKMGTWLAADGERAVLKDKKGNMPIVHATVDATHNMIAIGFVTAEDEKGLEAIQNVLTSIKPGDGEKKP